MSQLLAATHARLITQMDPKSPVVEAYRTLRTNLQYTRAGGELRTLLVTSPGPGEGKSTISANLACVMAQSGKRVIAVTADLRRPALRKYFGLENPGIGLTNTLVGEASLEECLQPTGVENLRLLTAGPLPPNPAELLESERMNWLIEELRAQSDAIAFDAPPILAVADASILAPLVDGVLLVVNVGTVPGQQAKQSKEQLEKVGARILGAVLNRVGAREGYEYYYYYSETEEVSDGLSPQKV